MSSMLELVRDKARADWTRDGILEEQVRIVARPLTAQQAIGDAGYGDFPIQKGKEKLMEATFREARGQAFTDHFAHYSGTLREVVSLPLESNFSRAVFVATLNAVLRSEDRAGHTIHCRDDGPRNCAAGLSGFLRERFSAPRIAQIGFQPAMIGALHEAVELRVLDMDPDNVGQVKRGVLVEGPEKTLDAVAWADVLLVTGTTFANDSISVFLTDKPVVFYGTTIAGAAALMGWERYCPCSE
ncbi:MAG: DUF364 domain-containing protein [Desulfovibrio sp.]